MEPEEEEREEDSLQNEAHDATSARFEEVMAHARAARAARAAEKALRAKDQPGTPVGEGGEGAGVAKGRGNGCLLYTSDAADDMQW
eukprot:2272393-Rhodomonas_salina.1